MINEKKDWGEKGNDLLVIASEETFTNQVA